MQVANLVLTVHLPPRHGFSLTLLAADRPALFATISGVLAGWGMNINKADAFANAAGVILDTFHFADLHHTLELNPSESERSEEHTSELQSQSNLVCRLLLEKKTQARLLARS